MGIMDMAKMLGDMNKLKSEMKKIQDQLSSQFFEASVGGAKAVVSGDLEVKSISFEPTCKNENVTAAVNAALTKAKEASAQSLGSLTQGMNLPGLNR